MDLQSVLNLIIFAVSAGFGWFAKEMWSAVKELKNDLSKLREELPKEYIAKNDFRDGIMELKSILIAINIKLDHKVDK